MTLASHCALVHCFPIGAVGEWQRLHTLSKTSLPGPSGNDWATEEEGKTPKAAHTRMVQCAILGKRSFMLVNLNCRRGQRPRLQSAYVQSLVISFPPVTVGRSARPLRINVVFR